MVEKTQGYIMDKSCLELLESHGYTVIPGSGACVYKIETPIEDKKELELLISNGFEGKGKFFITSYSAQYLLGKSGLPYENPQ